MRNKSGEPHVRPKCVRNIAAPAPAHRTASKTSADEDGVCYSFERRPRRVQLGPPQPGDSLPRVIVPRIYSSADPVVRFRKTLPQKLRDRGVDESEWAQTMETIHKYFEEGEKYGLRTCFETFTTLITANLISYFRKTNFEKALDKLVAYVEEQNRNVYARHFIHIVNPTLNGFLELEIILLPMVPVTNLTAANPGDPCEFNSCPEN